VECVLIGFGGLVVFGIIATLASMVIVSPREEVIVLNFGKYEKTIAQEGLHWAQPIGRELRRIPTQDITLHVPTSTVVEKNGNPILISAVVVYRVEDTRKAALDVENFRRFIEDQAGAVIKRVSSQFPYESADHSQPCLKSESHEVTDGYLRELQKAVTAAGIKVVNVQLNDLTYAPEIAQAMLMRQQALALIDARKTIVEGAVSIVADAIERLRAAGLEVAPEQREVLIANLLVVLCSGERAQPVLQVQAGPKST
jgi:regulator of protease activity HflC (stomatin/prohibitin superfamily)